MTTIALAGNPNTGKTTLFNRLTGARERIGNWSGVTVERAEAVASIAGQKVRVVDLPGIYSLSAHTLDEQAAYDFIVNERPDLIVNIVDASNIERSLYLTLQLIDMGVPLVVVLNFTDIATRRGIRINVATLAQKLGVPVFFSVASRGSGMKKLERTLTKILSGEKQIEPSHPGSWCLHSDGSLCDDSPQGTEMRQQCVRSLLEGVVRRDGPRYERFSDRVDRVILSRWAGLPLFLAIMYGVFWVAVGLSEPLVEFVDSTAQLFLVDGLRHLLEMWHLPALLVAILCDGIGVGAAAVASFAPPIFAIFFCLGILEESGYMPRAAFVLDRILRAIGLPGKAFIPLMVGFGCTVPALLSTRTLEERRDRILTMLLSPFMSCGARLPVYTLFALAFFEKRGNMIVFALYITGVLLAVASGLLLKRTIFRGDGGAYIMELPTYQIPPLRNCLNRAWFNLRSFLIRAGQVIILIAIVLTLLRSAEEAWSGASESDTTTTSLSETVAVAAVPLFEPMGIDRDNWQAVIGLMTGLMAKESVIGTLDVVYSQQAQRLAVAEAEPDPEASFSIREPLRLIFGQLAADYGLAPPPEEPPDSTGLISSIRSHFKTGAAAFAYLLFVLIYSPCLAALTVLGREAGWRWMWFSVAYQTLLAWACATLFYQLATFSQDPQRATIWLFVALTALLFMALLLVVKGRRGVGLNEKPQAEGGAQ
jgi:ferrous iron transport protein B